MLLREVFGWLRYCLQQDAVCVANHILVEEIPSTFLAHMDVSDGPRTLALYKAESGYSPRIEIRFTAERPQVWWIGSGEGGEHGTYLLSPFSSRFPGDFRSWTRTQFVHYLLDLAKAKLCNDTVTFVSLIPNVQASYKVEALKPPKMDLDGLMRIVEAAHRSVKKGTKITPEKIQKYLADNFSITALNSFHQLAYDAVYYLSKGKLQVNDLEALEAAVKKGSGGTLDLWAPLCSILQDPALQDKLNPIWVDRIQECAPSSLKDKVAANTYLEEKIRQIVQARNEGLEPETALSSLLLPGEFGSMVEAAFKNNGLPLPYLDLLEKADYKEHIAPWSMIRRSILAYEAPKKDSSLPIEEAVVEWLDGSKLTEALYRSDDDLVKDLIKKKIQSFVQGTVSNPSWVKAVCDDIVGRLNGHDLDRSLQSEFDVWLLQALSPSVSASKLPLSPHAYNTGKQDEALYNKVLGAWVSALKKSAAERRSVSVKHLADNLDGFYKQVLCDWNRECLEGYTPRVPSVKDIMAAATEGDKDKLLCVLVADLEDETGTKVPAETKTRLLASPYLTSIYREIRFQSLKL